MYNDPAIAIAWLLDQGAERVAYVDIDVHHGDGVQAAFWDDPRVRTWTHLLAEAAGRPIGPDTPTPQAWRDYVQRRTGRPAPELMTDGHPAVFPPFESGYDPAEPVDRAIMATRNAVFPLNGLMPLH